MTAESIPAAPDVRKLVAEALRTVPFEGSWRAVAIGNVTAAILADRASRPEPTPAGVEEAVAWQWRYHSLETTEWSEWKDGRAPSLRSDSYETEERPLFATRTDEEAIRRAAFPALTEAMMIAAAEAHYGKARVAANGGIDAISMAVDDRDYSFRDMMRRMGPAIRRARLRAEKAAAGGQP